MPSKYLTTALRALWPVYRVPQPNTPPAIEMDLPVQLVHDVGRDAAAARGFPAVAALVGTTLTDASPLYLEQTRDELLADDTHGIASMLRVRQLGVHDVDVWIRGTQLVLVSAQATFTRATSGMRHGTPIGGGVAEILNIWISNNVRLEALTSGGATLVGNLSASVASFGPRLYPILLEDDQESRLYAVGQGVNGQEMEFAVFFHLWIAPAGTRYP